MRFTTRWPDLPPARTAEPRGSTCTLRSASIGKCGDFADVVDPLPVDDDQRQLAIFAELGLYRGQQLIDRADAVSLDLGLIEASFGEDVAEQPLANDDDVRLLRLGSLRVRSGNRVAGLGGYRGAGEQCRRGEPLQPAALVRCT